MKTCELVTRTIDIEIAELKGYDVDFRNRKHKSKRTLEWQMRKILPNGRKMWVKLSFYSTSWVDVKELWDELEKHFNISFGKHKGAPFYVLSLDDRVCNGKDFADCVSTAWLVWKKGKECYTK